MFFQLYRTSGLDTASEGVRPSGLPTPHPRCTPAIRRRWLGCIRSLLPTDCCYLPRGTVGTKEYGSLEHGFCRSPAQALLSTLLWLDPFSEECSGTPDTTGAPTREKSTGSSKLCTTRICPDWNFFPQPHCPYPGCRFTHIAYPAQKTHCQETRTTKSSTTRIGPVSHRGPQHVP